MSDAHSTQASTSIFNENKFLIISIAVPLFILFAFSIYWVNFRDTWEVDNFETVNQLCSDLEKSIRNHDYKSAEALSNNLNELIGDRLLIRETLATRVSEVNKQFQPVKLRIEKARQKEERDKIAKQKQDETRAIAETNDRLAREAAIAANQPRERYYRDSHGAIVSESETEDRIFRLRMQIDAMPNKLEQAYLTGVLKALEKEWERIKLQGPIDR